MAVNKVVFAGQTLLDLTADTVTESDLANGVTAHKMDGTKITGTMVVQKFRTGTSKPDDFVGDDGDLFFVTGG